MNGHTREKEEGKDKPADMVGFGGFLSGGREIPTHTWCMISGNGELPGIGVPVGLFTRPDWNWRIWPGWAGWRDTSGSAGR